MDDVVASNAGGLHWAFPGGLPLDQLELWLLASPERQKAVLARIEAIRGWVAFGRSVPSVEKERLASLAGVTSGRLRNLVGEWRSADGAARSLGMLGLRIEPPRRHRWTSKDAYRMIAERVLDDVDPGRPGAEASVESVVALARRDSRLAGTRSLGTLRELVRERRRRRSNEVRFGAHLAIDDVELAMLSPRANAYRLRMIIDVETGLVLGFAFLDALPGLSTLEAALLDAASRLDGLQLPGVPSDGESRITIAMGDEDVVVGLRLFRAVPWLSERRGVRGRMALQIIGDRLGRIPIRPGLERLDAAIDRGDARPVVHADDVATLLARAFEAHNGRLLAAGPETLAMTERRRYVAAMLREAALQVLPKA